MHVSKHEKLVSKHETIIKIFHSKEGFSSRIFSHKSKNMIQHHHGYIVSNMLLIYTPIAWSISIMLFTLVQLVELELATNLLN